MKPQAKTKQAIGLYARISTHNGQTTETQLIPMRKFCKDNHLTPVREYVDEGVSGAKEKRPALDKMMEDVQNGELSTVLVWRFDRFARSLSHLEKALTHFNQAGVRFISLTENADTSTPQGRFLFQIIGAVAQMEIAIIKERIKAGMARVMKINPKTRKPLRKIGGWRATKKDGSPRAFRKPIPPNPELVQQIRRLSKKGLSLRSIGEEVKRSHTLVAKLLK